MRAGKKEKMHAGLEGGRNGPSTTIFPAYFQEVLFYSSQIVSWLFKDGMNLFTYAAFNGAY